MKRGLALLVAACLSASASRGNEAEDWQAIVALDAGPRGAPRSAEEARTLASRHLGQQERLLRGFIAAHPQDGHAFEARLRLARLLEIRGGFEDSETARAEARRLLDQLEKAATPEQRVEVDFSRVTRLMRGARKAPREQRDQLLAAARKFHAEHPGDRRVPALFVEVATLFDGQPRTKAALLTDASALATDAALKGRIADDLRRVDLLGQEIALSFTSLQGKPVKLEDYRGRLVLIVFFADFSPPSTEALGQVQRAVSELPKERVAVVGINLDSKRETVDALLKNAGLTWPVAFDGKGWQGELVRSFGINALPTVWLLDKRGQLRSLNALEGLNDQLRQLARE